MLREFSKRCLILPTLLQFLRNQQLSLAKSYRSITFLKKYLISKELQIIGKKTDTVLISV